MSRQISPSIPSSENKHSARNAETLIIHPGLVPVDQYDEVFAHEVALHEETFKSLINFDVEAAMCALKNHIGNNE